MCRARGVGGVIADDIDVTEILAEVATTLECYGVVFSPGPTYPDRLVEPVGLLLQSNADVARELAFDLLSAQPQSTGP